ncbi:hypothetical protein [Flaviaesturariibacter aridisoli]|uniref:Lipocalin-like domain-containing protein n=1 Tax=Flaviaesturariibacter aridisoli TaxID=2545761 RepID=A0A4R4DTF5_9BACT|nr:hypothetical protein [Flaviaesturariibacter aridisoli]TCZ65268.1 hypothetical protein E0486_17395 [Flaviaesturariibacter aridisoli]
MKSILPAIAGTILFASVFASCSWLNRKAEPHSDIAGTWRLDSVVDKNDSVNPLPAVLVAMAAGDTVPVTYRFTADSLHVVSGSDVFESAPYRYEKPQITILDSSKEQMQVSRPSDSVLVLRTSDSSRMFFTRQ